MEMEAREVRAVTVPTAGCSSPVSSMSVSGLGSRYVVLVRGEVGD